MNDFERVKSRIDIVRFISEKTGKATKAVGNTIDLEECPFCNGHNCFRIDPVKRTYHCFQCPEGEGSGGDVFNFLMAFENLDKGGALREAALAARVELSTKGRQKKPTTGQKIRLEAVSYFSKALWGNGRSTHLLEKRGHTKDVLERMKVGYSDGGLAAHLLKSGHNAQDILETGLAKENGAKGLKDYFAKDLYIYPHMKDDEVFHFTQKDPNKKFKYQIPTKHRHKDWRFYNQDALSRYNEIIVCEGEDDVQAWMDAGQRNVLGLIGQLSKEQATALLNFCKGKHLYLCFDNDEAGRKYTRTIVKALHEQDYHLKVVIYPGGDIDEHLRGCVKDKKQTEAKRLLGASIPPLAWEIEQIKGLSDLDRRLAELRKHRIFDRISDLVQVEQDVYVDKLVALGFTKEGIEKECEESDSIYDEVMKYLGGLEDKKKADANQLAAKIYKGFGRKGRWFFDREDNCYLFHGHKIYKIGSNRPFNALMKKHTSLLPVKEPGRSVWESLASECYNTGREVQVMSWLFTCRKTDSVYVNFNSDKNTILKIGKGKVEELPNGINKDEVLLSSSSRIMPFNYHPDCKVEEGMALLKELIFDNLTCDVEQRYLILTWLMSCFLIDFAPYAALMKMSGSSASGKTTAARLLSLLIYGDEHISDPTASAAYTVAAQNPLLVIDNLESEDMTKALGKFLLLSATKGKKEKRKGGTDTQTVDESPKALVIITAIEPFAKPEQINRTYDIEFSPRWHRDEFVEDDVIGNIVKGRDLMLSAIIKIISEQILPNLDRRRDYNVILKKEYRAHAKERTNEFLALLMLQLEKVLNYIPYYDEDEKALKGNDGAKDIRKAWIEYQDKKAKDTETGTNPILTMLQLLWGEFRHLYDKRGDDTTIKHQDYTIDMEAVDDGAAVEFVASSQILFGTFSKLSRTLGTPNPFKNPRQLGVRMGEAEKTLKEGGWTLIRKGDSPYFSISHGERRYKFHKRLKSSTTE